MAGRPYRSMEDRLLSLSVLLPNGCWEWVGALRKASYGGAFYGTITVRVHGKPLPHLAHRLSYVTFTGLPIPAGLELAHTCHYPRCINPMHLVPTTHALNIAMSVAAGRITILTGCPTDPER